MTYKEYRRMVLMEIKQAMKVQNDFSYSIDIRKQAHYIVECGKYDLRYESYIRQNMDSFEWNGTIAPFYRW